MAVPKLIPAQSIAVRVVAAVLRSERLRGRVESGAALSAHIKNHTAGFLELLAITLQPLRPTWIQRLSLFC